MNEPKAIQYLPPEPEVFDQLARRTCDVLSESIQPRCDSDEVVDGLSTFLKVIARLTAYALSVGNANELKHTCLPKEKRTKEGLNANKEAA